MGVGAVHNIMWRGALHRARQGPLVVWAAEANAALLGAFSVSGTVQTTMTLSWVAVFHDKKPKTP
jgi:hypothetical protein